MASNPRETSRCSIWLVGSQPGILARPRGPSGCSSGSRARLGHGRAIGIAMRLMIGTQQLWQHNYGQPTMDPQNGNRALAKLVARKLSPNLWRGSSPISWRESSRQFSTEMRVTTCSTALANDSANSGPATRGTAKHRHVALCNVATPGSPHIVNTYMCGL